MELMPNARFRMQAIGKMAVGKSYGFLPSVNIATDISPSRVYIAAGMRYFGVQLNFNLDMRFRGATPYIQTFKLTMDFSGLFNAIKTGARAVLGHTLYKLANMIGVFSSFWIGKASFAMTERSISLAVNMRIYFSINLRVKINTGTLSDIFNKRFASVARSSLNNMLRSLRVSARAIAKAVGKRLGSQHGEHTGSCTEGIMWSLVVFLPAGRGPVATV